MTADIWRHLGIAETDDEGAIRRAYAERLKVTNPEDDPEGFKRLRSAYERALQQARWRARYPETGADVGDDEWDEELPADLAEALPQARAPRGDTPVPPEAPRERDPELEAHDKLCEKLEQVVAAGASPWEIQAAFQALVTNPAMERLDIYASTENWVANLIRRHNGGGPLFDAATAHFKWNNTNRMGDLGANMQSFRDMLADEKNADAFMARVKDRRHEFHIAYKETSRRLEERNWLSRLLSFPRIDIVRRFLDYVEDKVPYAQDELDYAAIDWWRQRINFWITPLNFISRAFPIAFVIGAIVLLAQLVPDDELSHPMARVAERLACMQAVENPASGPEACDSFLEDVPDSLSMRQFAGIIALRQGRTSDARTHFETILQSSPLDPAARYGLGLALRGDPDENMRATTLMREALAIDDTVSIYFAQYGVPTIDALDPAPTYAPFPDPEMPAYDTEPGTITMASESTFDDAYDHFGIAQTYSDGRVRVQCYLRTTGLFTDCQIIEETPRNRDRGELALRIMQSARATPATLNGEPVDLVAVRVPVRFSREAVPE